MPPSKWEEKMKKKKNQTNVRTTLWSTEVVFFFFFYYLQFLLFHADFRVLLCSGQGRSQSLLPLALGPLWNRCSDRDGCLHDADGGVFWKVIQLWRTQRLWWDVHTAQDLNPFPRAFFFHTRFLGILGCVCVWAVADSDLMVRFTASPEAILGNSSSSWHRCRQQLVQSTKKITNEKNKQRKSLPVL